MPSGLLGRSLLILMTPMLLLQIVTVLIFFERHWDTVARQLSRGLAGDIAFVIDYLGEYSDADHFEWLQHSARTRLQLDILFEPDEILERQITQPPFGLVSQELFNALNERLQRPFFFDLDVDDRKLEIRVQLKDGVLSVVAPRKRLYSSTTYIFFMWIAGSALILYGVAVMFMRNQVRPIRRLAKAADQFGRGVEVDTFKPEGAAEVRLAASSFISMRDRIARHLSQRTALLAGVSHDLRTPLTRMKLELAMQGSLPGVEALKQDVVDMERMVDAYLAFARGEEGEKAVPTDIGKLITDQVGESLRDGQQIDLHIADSLEMDLRPQSVRRCLANIMSNAGRYANNLSVRAGRRGQDYEIVFDDDGPGIPVDKREDVFKPFYRLEESRNQATGGVGLGMTIARDSARGHGGDVFLEDAPGGGLRVRLVLPIGH
ncbi:two-component system, OmpR family, osmolarity sensor histidine kinase EnvZ [Thalassospira xiamenensis]|uniref:histidine kinase n=2 Tax=Thalassospira xiamenensis TaxID=220697 RepID=A0A285TJ81_9PROT|nr:two-component system, OmpR family, osmolarity sensor histidine kinase EnvZ [Thalassospira xiamenensis]